MFKNLLPLIKIQLSSTYAHIFRNFSKKRNTSNSINNSTSFTATVKLVLGILFAIYLVCSVSFASFSIFSVLLSQISEITSLWLYFAIVLIASLLFSVLGGVFAAKSYMFDAKDNELLLSMPIKPSKILISRLSALYILSFIYSFFVTIPSAVAFNVFVGFSFINLIFSVLSVLIIPLFSTAISSLLGFIVGFIASKVPKNNIVGSIFGFLFVGLYLLFFYNMDSFSSTLLANVEEIMAGIKTYFPVAYWYGQGVAEQDILNFLLFILVVVVCCVLIFYLIAKKFVKIVATKKAVRKVEYKEKSLKVNKPIVSIFKKEVLYFFHLPGYMFNCGFGTIFVILLSGSLFFVSGEIDVMFSDPQVAKFIPIIPIGVAGAMSTICAINDVTAPSISLEGKTLWILKSTPLRVRDIFVGKMLLSVGVCLPAIVFATIVTSIFLPMDILGSIFIFVVSVLCSVFSGFLGICVNLLLPRFDWTSEIMAIKQGGSVIVTLFASMFLVSPMFVIFSVIQVMIPNFQIIISYLGCVLYFVILIGLEILFLRFKGKKIFNNFIA